MREFEHPAVQFLLIFIFSAIFSPLFFYVTLLPPSPTQYTGSVVHFRLPPTHAHTRRTLWCCFQQRCRTRVFYYIFFVFIYFLPPLSFGGWCWVGNKRRRKEEVFFVGGWEGRWRKTKRGRRRLDVATMGRPISVGTTLKPSPKRCRR